MGILDRNYDRPEAYRDSDGGARGLGRGLDRFSVTIWLIIINIAVFLADFLLTQRLLSEVGHFSTYKGFQVFQVWRLVTYQFLHADITHIAFNMLGLWVFAPIVEEHLGRRRFLAYYLVCGIFGALLYTLLNMLGRGLNINIPGVLFNDLKTPLIGASAGVFGVIMGAAYIVPHERVTVMFLPVEIQMRTLAYAYLGISVVSLLLRTDNAGGEAAHIGGAVAGYYFVRNSHLLRDFFDVLEDSRRAPDGRGARRVVKPTRTVPRSFGGMGGAPEASEVDRILDKVREGGLGSLSEREKETLRRSTEAKRTGMG